ncbi:MAG: ABC transporter ATP-binding protein [Candidatus Peribacteraceae bacterium]|nr:ABC transporter ATP-binding protein [Candidatus Peribacteraceae bacterium]
MSKATIPPYSAKQLVNEIWRHIRPYRRSFIVATLLRLTADIIWLYPAYALSRIVTILSQGQSDESLSAITFIIGLWIVASVIRFANTDTAKYMGFTIAERIGLDAQYEAISHLLRLNMSWQEKENTGNKIKRLQRGSEGLAIITRMWFINFIEIFVNFVGMSIIIAGFDWKVACIVLLFLITYFFFSVRLTRKTVEKVNIVNIAEEEVSGLAFEIINNIRTVKVLGIRKPLLGILRSSMNDLFTKIRARVLWFRIRQITLSGWGQVFRLSAVVVIVYGIWQGYYPVGFLILFYGYFDRIWGSVDELSQVAQEFSSAQYSIARMADILSMPAQSAGHTSFPDNWKKMEVRNLRFSYGRNTVLKDVSFTIKRGEKIGIVGLSGAGKSTLMRILLKEREEYEGDIFIDDVPLRDIKRDEYFARSAAVLQDTEVFNFSLKDNITIAQAAKKNDAQLLKNSLEIAHVKEYLPKLPQGVDTLIGEKGIKLSGGERQRLGLARAIFKQPDILFLDEATSHLDLESEQKIRDSLQKFFRSVTAVVIAHRLTTIREMDTIIVLEQGTIIESGSFDTLIAKKGRFFALWQKQKL